MNPNTKKSGTSPETREKTASPPPAFDTLQTVKKLKNAEFGEKQAVTLVETLQDAQNELATKADLGQMEFVLRSDMERTELALRGDMERMELALRSDMGKMESSIRADMQKMESGIRADMQKMESGIRTDMGKMESGIRADMGKVELRLRGDFEDRFTSLHRFLLIGGGVMTAILSVVITLAATLAK